jgi:hypothetical protein
MTDTVSSEALNYRYEHGRRYHAYEDNSTTSQERTGYAIAKYEEPTICLMMQYVLP